METTTPVCAIIPPHILDKLAQSDDPVVYEPARRTLEHDAALRTQRRVASTRGNDTPGGTPSDKPQRTVYDAGHQDRTPGTKVHAESDQPSKDQTVNRAHDGLGATFDFYLKVYGRRSIDGSGLPLDATVHYGDKYGNALWDGERVVLGDGFGDLFLDFTLALDVIAHELTHGVIQHTANLENYGQSGALNESVSDVFGSLVKQYALGQTADQADWLIGNDMLGPGFPGTALRSLKAPGTAYDDDLLGKDPQPASMDHYVRTPRDNGGVHINSGIPNHAFYQLATTLGGHAWERAGHIWYATLTGGELASDASFADFARLTVASARSLYGDDGEEIQALLKAWSTVGVPAT
ncbi:M4 family metallopeptidase [Kitasatospora sp. NPDC097691]|uniref:M4 family metallopeptidase n=1 Tax=Kitasatospora sp. NPDC097691 TaxID=3157231 RepID=UPI0033178E6F